MLVCGRARPAERLNEKGICHIFAGTGEDGEFGVGVGGIRFSCYLFQEAIGLSLFVDKFVHHF